MRSRVALLAFFSLASSFLLPLIAEAAIIPFFGPIVPDCGATNTNALGWGAVVLVINNLILFSITLLIVFVAPLVIAWAGFLLVASSVNPEGKARARSILLNLVIGIVVALIAWLIVNLIMITLTTNNFGGKTWFQVVSSGGAPTCLDLTTKPVPTPTPTPGGVTPVPSGTAPDGTFTYQSGIYAQYAQASFALKSLISCMEDRVPGNVGDVSSISDSTIVGGANTFQKCATGTGTGCQHATNSCHYGGSSSCMGSSYAIDFGDEPNYSALDSGAKACGATYVALEGNHVHVSVGARFNCSCN